ncbi:hypothetical protein RHODGE_RHODGE_01041 [Rhodoplanes serenus]|uniref:Uncharacterized protein n=1 Tax=Rhodoplanes serenus TaxID=200615 RepID=A0A3S4CFK1_9BRAD|nr:hypothetical protein [Rhodoplanes serenus]VCU06566.1 hypothetical protein RHODPL_RHODPL_00014 [Rhodoplanes serenus]VCU07891.1 hypothetical protein RHODGE_RHODGE_01041 [Rhodoplanes serenus]
MALGGVYATGTASFTAGSTAVTGAGTLWASANNVLEGDWIWSAGQIGIVAAVPSNTTLVLQDGWTGSSAAGAAYRIVKMSWLRYDTYTIFENQNRLLTALDAGLLPSGATRPQSVAGGGLWRKIVSATAHQINYHDGADDIALLTVDPVANTAKLPAAAAPREVLTANRTYYVRTDGSDSNTGLANTVGGAFLTIQRAIDVASALDLSIYNVVIVVGAGTYTGALRSQSLVGSGMVFIVGDEANPGNVLINPGAIDVISGENVRGIYAFRGMKITSSGGGSGIRAVGSTFFRFRNIDFGACGVVHIYSQYGGRIDAEGDWRISGGATYHLLADGGLIAAGGRTVTLTGTPNFVGCFALAQKGTGIIDAALMTFVGGATGTRYVAQFGGQIATAGGGANYFPGNTAGNGTNFGVAPYGMYS